MWLPTPIYEALPYAYVVAGITLIGGATYIGLGSGESSLYLGTGAICVLSGVLVYVRRNIARSGKPANSVNRGAKLSDQSEPVA